MNRAGFIIGALVGVLISGLGIVIILVFKSYTFSPFTSTRNLPLPTLTPEVHVNPTPEVGLKVGGDKVLLKSAGFVSQTFNNCGPATLSMILKFYGKEVGQDILGQQMRPYQIPNGDNDDKSIFADEFVTYAQKYGFEALSRPNGDLETLKKSTANGIPVVVRTWLHPGEDIGHFRVVRGYDDTRQVVIQDDSYQGANIEYSYQDFIDMWQPFNYGYMLVYPKEKEPIVQAILKENRDEKSAWQNALAKAVDEERSDPTSVYPIFNQSVAQYYLGDYKKSVELYERVDDRIPRRMLWYQIEPIEAYEKVGDYEWVFRLTDWILNNNNRAFSELYQIRGESLVAQGKKEEARAEFEKAIFYNKNFEPAKKSLTQLN